MSVRTIYCSRCCLDLPVDAFRASRIKAVTKKDRCKKCLSELASAWNAAHPERRAIVKAKHRPKELERMRRWNAEHRAQLTEYMRVWREQNRERAREIAAAARKRNHDAVKAAQRERAAAKRGATPTWANKDAIRAIYLEARRLRKETGLDWHVDHIIPLNGKTVCGLHVETNLRIIRGIENMRKGNRLMEAYH